MKTEELTKLITMLEGMQSRGIPSIDLDNWWNDNEGCGCVIGEAIQTGVIGLKLVRGTHCNKKLYPVLETTEISLNDVPPCNFDAVAQYLDLPIRITFQLFCTDEYGTNEPVPIERIIARIEAEVISGDFE